ncbi:MAG: hypothetical protein ACI9K1_002568 [Arcticibacterium sp.]|jgi:hypothetical protein
MSQQCTHHIFMIRPISFGFNEETAESNAFMQGDLSDREAQRDAANNFDSFVTKLRISGINVIVFEDDLRSKTPDSIFPNNWISFHSDGKVILYPMEAENRRLERRMDILEKLGSEFEIDEVIDLSSFEKHGKFLEGTGSLVLDRSAKIAYACFASRTNPEVIAAWKKHFVGYEIVGFVASDANNVPIYHTNVMMCIAEDFSVLCAESIKDLSEKEAVIRSLKLGGKEPLLISLDQMNEFAGNMLQVKNDLGQPILVMSSRAFRSLRKAQLDFLYDKTKILHAELGSIETLGGGSARCMMTEIHLHKK